MPFIGPLKGRERRIPRSGDTQGGGRTPHTSFRRHSRPFGQAYAPSEVSGILFMLIFKKMKGKTTFFLKV